MISLVVGSATALLVYTSINANNETLAMVTAGILFIPFVLLIKMQRREKSRTERLVENGVNHYRSHIHIKRVIKKTS